MEASLGTVIPPPGLGQRHAGKSAPTAGDAPDVVEQDIDRGTMPAVTPICRVVRAGGSDQRCRAW
jgi:hypothetical protein